MNYYRNFSFTSTAFIITHTRKTFARTASGKSWKSKPEKEYSETVKPEYYTNYVTSIPFFNNLGTCRAQHRYTAAGYLPVVITSVSPDRTIKHIDSFNFEYIK